MRMPRCAIGENAPLGSDARYLLRHNVGAPILHGRLCRLAPVAGVLKRRDAMWTVLIVEHAHEADPQVIANLLLDFVEAALMPTRDGRLGRVDGLLSRALGAEHGLGAELLTRMRLHRHPPSSDGADARPPEVPSAQPTLPPPRSKIEKRVKDRAQRWFNPSAIQDYEEHARAADVELCALGHPPATLSTRTLRERRRRAGPRAAAVETARAAAEEQAEEEAWPCPI